MEISGRHFFITGSGKRIGRRLAESFLEKGARLSAHVHTSKKEGDELFARFPGKVHRVQADLRKIPEIQAAVISAEKKWGPIDVLINCASPFYPTPFFDCTESEWDDLLGGNLKGQFFLCQAVAKNMKSGVILNLCDVNANTPMKNFSPYVSAKAGLLMLTKNLAFELAPQVRVNSISPGPVLLPEHYTPLQRQRTEERTLLKRLGSPEDIVAAAHFIIENDYLTGIDLKVDGGRSLAEK